MWLEIFKKGIHKDSKGRERDFSEDFLDEISQKYNESIARDSSLEAPLVKGHPKSNEPAYGWIEKLSRKGDRLLAKIKDLSPELTEQIRKGMFKKVSMAIYPDNMLRHVGLLGAFPPAVKGLKYIEFEDEGDLFSYAEEANLSTDDYNDLIEYTEQINSKLKCANSKITELENQIKEEKKTKRKAELLEFCENLNANGMQLLTPAQNKKLSDVLLNIEELNSEFIEEITDILNNINPINIDNIKDDLLEIQELEFSEDLDSQRLTLHNKAIKLIKNNKNISYEDAILKSINYGE